MAAVQTIPGRKIARFGVETPQHLVWRGWEPGREYTKSLILKNVQFKTQKLKFRLPSHSFSTEYPQSIVLSAGTSYTLPITFRPLEKREYEEYIEFQTGGQTFMVPFKAQLPTPDISLPESAAFGVCAVQDSLSMKLEMTNTGDTPADFHWDISPPFEIIPSSGTLAVKETCQLDAIFSPTTAHAFEAQAVCCYGGERQYKKSIKLEGVGKYPCLVAKLVSKKVKSFAPKPNGAWTSELAVNFGDVPVATVQDAQIEISNVSSVVGHFSLTPLPQGDLRDQVFLCSVVEGAIPPGLSHRIKITYSPHTPSLTSVGYFELVTHGGVSKTTIKCIGHCTGPLVRISEECINFGSIECGRSSSGVLHIRNDSSVPAVFKIGLDRSSVFSADILSGCIGGGMVQSIPLSFHPPRPMAYHRRVTVLVQNHSPLFVDLIGNAYTETVKPAVMLPKHLRMFVQRVKNGLSRYSPEQIHQLLSRGKVTVGEDGGLCPTEGMDTRTSSAYRERGSLYERVIAEEAGLDAGSLPHVSSDLQELQFEYCREGELSESKVVNVCNHTEGKMMCIWVHDQNDVFQVVPEEREIQPGKAASFAITFRPKKASMFYMREMEYFVFYKSLRDHRQVEDHSISPPWCLTVKASGHTFAPGSEVYMPKIELDSRNLLMPPTEPHQPVYRTLTMKNTGDCAVLYEFQPDPSGTFTIKPERGLLEDDYQVFVVKMKPLENKTYKHVLPLTLNLTDKFNQNVLISGRGEVPSVQLEHHGHVYFRPTCTGDHSTVAYRVLNTSRLQLNYQWKLTNEDPSVAVSVSPSSGVIHPYEAQHHQWTFSPKDPKPYRLSAMLHLSATDQIKSKRQKESIELHGEGCSGEISCEPQDVDFGTVVIGTSSSHKLTVSNPSLCNLHYQIITEESIREDGRATVRMEPSHGVRVSPTEGVLPGGSQSHLTVTVKPWQKGVIHTEISYKLVLTGEVVQGGCDKRSKLCGVRVQGVYPTLTVVDVQGEGTAAGYSKSRMWAMLSVDRLIHCLKDEPSVEELRYAIATRHSTRRRVDTKTRASVDFNFGICPVDSKPSVIHLLLFNDGSSPTDWAFQFPEDMYLEPEYWADKADLDETEQHELHLTSHKLFQVLPKSGTLDPQQHQKVTLTCSHEQCIKAKLPILLKINRGREILINFLGQTIAKGDTLLELPTEHTFAPVPVGTTAPPRQKFLLHNGGELSVSYHICTSPLDDLKKENFMMDILECLQPKGEIPAHESISVEFIFSPLEAKRYMVDLSLELSNGQSSQVTFVGDGVLVSPRANDTPPSTTDQELLPVQQYRLGAPAHRKITLPEQLATISRELLDFGHVPLFMFARQLVHLTNTSPHTVSFKWDLRDEAAHILTVDPREGYLQPSASSVCRVTLYSRLSPAFHNLDVQCQVMDETKYSLYRDQLAKWENQEEEKKHIFTLTEKDIHQDTMRPQTMPKTSTVSKLRSSQYSEIDIKKYQTLPPIRSQTADSNSQQEFYEDWKKKDMSTRSKARPRAKRQVEPKCPEPPEPYVLHLGVVARTHGIADWVKFISNMDSVHLDSHILVRGGLTVPGDDPVTDGEKELLTDVLTHLIRDCLADGDFKTSVVRLSEEDMPYFNQFVDSHPPQHGGQKAARHMYATALASIADSKPKELEGGGWNQPGLSTRVPQPEQDHSFAISEPLDTEGHHDNTHEQDEVTQDEEDSCLTFPKKEILQQEEILKNLPEFHHLARNILENTILNVMKEASCGELDLRHTVKAIALPMPPSRQPF